MGEFLSVSFDPLNSAGEWRDNPSYIQLHTQDPGGSMDDRFDLQLLGEGLADGSGIEWIEGSYTVFGNDGTHTLNSTLDTGTGASVDVIQALIENSDHLPVVADYSY